MLKTAVERWRQDKHHCQGIIEPSPATLSRVPLQPIRYFGLQ